MVESRTGHYLCSLGHCALGMPNNCPYYARQRFDSDARRAFDQDTAERAMRARQEFEVDKLGGLIKQSDEVSIHACQILPPEIGAIAVVDGPVDPRAVARGLYKAVLAMCTHGKPDWDTLTLTVKHSSVNETRFILEAMVVE